MKYMIQFMLHFDKSVELLTSLTIETKALKKYIYSLGKEYKRVLLSTSIWLQSEKSQTYYDNVIVSAEDIDQNMKYSNFKLAVDGHIISKLLNIKGIDIGTVKSKLITLILNEQLENNGTDLKKYLNEFGNNLL